MPLNFIVAIPQKKIVKELKHSSVFSKYKDYIQFKTMTFDALKFPKKTPPHFLILSYVLDVITTSFDMEKGKLRKKRSCHG